MITQSNIREYQQNGVVFLKSVFESSWIDMLNVGISKDIQSPGKNFKSHTIGSGPRYIENYWVWDEREEFKKFVFHSPLKKIMADLLQAKSINLLMDNWFLREAGTKSYTPFHHDLSYFDVEGTMCALWLPLQTTKKDEAIAWVKGSHLWGEKYPRVWFSDGHKVDGENNVPDVLNNPGKYELLQYNFEVGDCAIFDVRTLHGTPNTTVPSKTLCRYTVRVAKEDAKIKYKSEEEFSYRTQLKQAGYTNGDPVDGVLFPKLYQEKKYEVETSNI